MKRILSMALAALFLLACCMTAPCEIALADGQKTVTLESQKIFNKYNITITADTLRYVPGGDIELDLGIAYSGSGERIVYLAEAYVNGWLVPAAEDPVFVLSGSGTTACTVKLDNSNELFAPVMQIEEVQSIKFAVRVFDGNYSRLGQSYSNEIVNPDVPADYVQKYDDSGEVLFDDDTARFTQVAYDPASFSAIVMVEKKQTSKWTELCLDPMYNGCRGTYSRSLFLDKGVRALVLFAGWDECGHFGIDTLHRMDIYALYYHSDRMQKPFMVTLNEEGSNAAMSERHMPTLKGMPVYEDEYCALYYAGADSEFYTDTDVIRFYCRNKTKDKVLALFTAYSYMLVDGKRVPASQANVNVYPESLSLVTLIPQDAAYYDLSRYDTVETTLGVYEIRGGYHEQLATTGKLDLPLHNVDDPLAGNAVPPEAVSGTAA